ncbi:hypothetical protein [Micromonospora sp. HK10]|uniref:hypothetical protein n=1 Tax=Micromonospora sp. HK10 TaxID=1538294 RepID=UPI0006272DB1|nr:hypothetical protein LQ51_25815 [Micromonospora sp. HK10]
MPAPPFPPPPAMASPAGGPVSAPPVVPAPALPVWPPPASPSAPGAAAGRTYSAGRPADRAGQQAAPDLSGTRYGGTEGPGFTTVSFPPGNPLENSGSLTGHILAQGWAEDGPATRSSNTRVVIVLAVALSVLIAISLLVVFLANDALRGLTGG